MAPDRLQRRALGSRGRVLAAILLAGVASAVALGLTPGGLLPGRGGLRIAGEFFARALSPALSWESNLMPQGAPPLLMWALEATAKTVLYAAAAMALALPLGAALGFFACTAWWSGDTVGGGRTPAGRFFRRAVAPVLYGATRVLIAFMRSIHELIWAVLFLAAMGLSPTAAVVAIAIPYAGTLAKVFSEMVDEAPRAPARALRALGANPSQVFWLGLVPAALRDMAAYAFYRFECALRSSAILGFFGLPTLGMDIRASFESAHYGEAWTYLYCMFALVLVFEWWSGALRLRGAT
jgi:phosphonate transport system permease protein